MNKLKTPNKKSDPKKEEKKETLNNKGWGPGRPAESKSWIS